MANPFAALIGSSSSSKNDENGAPISSLIENCFGFTLSRARSSKNGFVYLEEQALTFPDKELDLEILEHALFERLFLQNPQECVLSTEKNAQGEIYETRVIQYLFHCYTRTNELKNEELKKVLNSLVMRNVLTSLKQPELYEGQNVFAEFYDVLKSMHVLADKFFSTVYEAFHNDEGTYNKR